MRRASVADAAVARAAVARLHGVVNEHAAVGRYGGARRRDPRAAFQFFDFDPTTASHHSLSDYSL